MFMKTFEEKWTAWLDDQLTGKELAEFVASLPNTAAAEAEKQDAGKLRALLKRELVVSVLTNEDFFSHQLRERISREDEVDTDHGDEPRSWWTIPRLVLAGAASLALFLMCAFFVVREETPADQSQYLTQILNAHVDPAVGPSATVTMFESKEDRVTVLWTEGLKSLPSEYAAK
jgi:cytochrome c-type biogenesis protein CcmH/NrfG